MMIFAIDPGPVESAYVIFDARRFRLAYHGKVGNYELRRILGAHQELMEQKAHKLVIEYPKPRGQPMYTQLVDTILWIGRFVEVSGVDNNWFRMDRKDVKMTLCGDNRAKDSNVRAALLSRFPPTGGGKLGQVGIKAKPGPLYGVGKDIWAALGVAVAYTDMNKGKV